jgi:nicotinate-nucleotide adenylyltransferase
VAVYPGSFDPLTVAHLAVANAALEQLHLERVDLAVAAAPLGKPHLAEPGLPRLERVRAAIGDRPRLRAVGSTSPLIADQAAGYEVVVLGADKWDQVLDASWYEDEDHRDRALAALPVVAVAPRDGWDVRAWPGVDLRILEVPAHLGEVSATAVRAGRRNWAARPDRD